MKRKYGVRVKSVSGIVEVLMSIRYMLYMLFDPPSLRKSKYYRELKKLQLTGNRSLFLDRQAEIKEFFGVTTFYLLNYYLKYGFPNTERFKWHIERAFEGSTRPGQLKKAYDSVSFDYTIRLMLAYERYSMIIPYLGYLIEDSGKSLSEFKVLDYGCGVSDIGLLFSSFGAEVTIADLDNLRLDFTIWRFKKRGFHPKVVRIPDTEAYPKLPESTFDLIIATELFEHVRDPLRLLKNFTKALTNSGYLFDSMGGKFERDRRPQHLKEAFKIGQSKDYKEFYNKHYVQLSPKELPYLFKKKI